MFSNVFLTPDESDFQCVGPASLCGCDGLRRRLSKGGHLFGRTGIRFVCGELRWNYCPSGHVGATFGTFRLRDLEIPWRGWREVVETRLGRLRVTLCIEGSLELGRNLRWKDERSRGR